ncbi:MAG: YdcF family protein [Candidatus Nitrohelix vancouverensis]|uniref:YdcF family protein n=1 Tax=Candidatus Nitrohelix vancouverensis TaxID=2705534 RepID=A0A7T0G3Z1_9BACT|nr:MAG: YdcF family protein [Candidatus Nitrohelix vancouverensis]
MGFPSLFVRKMRWSLTAWGYLFFISPVLIALYFSFFYLHPFLATDQTVQGEVLVVDGWLSDSSLQEAAVFFNQGNYQYLIVTGGPISRGSYLSPYKTYAELGAATLRGIGFEKNKLYLSIPAPVIKDRTFATALSVKETIKSLPAPVSAIDVYTEGIHARRSLMLYELAFGDALRIGVTSAETKHYDAQEWWKSSAGVRQVINESIAYLYARFIFTPPLTAES